MQKIFNNFNFKIIKIIGLKYFSIYLFFSLINFLRIIKTKKLSHVDFLMGKTDINKFKLDSIIYFDCKFVDKNILEDTYTFGLIREIYFRNCYLKYIPFNIIKNIETTIDLGSNRGVFSCLSTQFSKKIVCVEKNSKYAISLQRNMELNSFSNFFIENKKILQDDLINSENLKNSLGIHNLFEKYEIRDRCLIKIDIEGWEESLFKETKWLNNINILLMEVHPKININLNIEDIINKLEDNKFNLVICDENLVKIKNTKNISFIFAYRN